MRLALLLATLLLFATPLAAAAEACVGGACVYHDGGREGPWSMECTAEGQTQWQESMVVMGDVWLAYTERCVEDGGYGWGYQSLTAGAAGQTAEVLWYQEGAYDARVCSLRVQGHDMACPGETPPPALP